MEYSHCVLDDEGKHVIGLAGQVERADERESFAYICLFGLEGCAEFGRIESKRLLPLKIPVSVEADKPSGEAVV